MRLQPDILTGYVNLFKSCQFERCVKKLCDQSYQGNSYFLVTANFHLLKLNVSSDGPALLCKDEPASILTQNSTAGACAGFAGGHKGTLQHGPWYTLSPSTGRLPFQCVCECQEVCFMGIITWEYFVQPLPIYFHTIIENHVKKCLSLSLMRIHWLLVLFLCTS